VGDGAVLEWMADLDAYSASWWNTQLGPLLSAVAAGKIKQIRHSLGAHVASVDTELEIEGRLHYFRCRNGLRGLMAWLFRLRGRSDVVRYEPWVSAAV